MKFRWAAAGLAAALLVLALNRESLGLGLAAARAEQRPELLRDATWERPDSAKAFSRRFRPGTRAADLIAWLRANDFEIDAQKGSASKRVAGFPCSEEIEIGWRTHPSGLLGSARAEVREAGCL